MLFNSGLDLVQQIYKTSYCYLLVIFSNLTHMQLNPKLIQYSLDIKYCQSKIIQDQHNQHLKKLSQIHCQSNLSKVKRQAQSLKNISDSINRYHQISRTFKSKENQQKRSYQDLKMIKSVSEIHKKKDQLEKVQTEHNQTYVQFKKRKQNHKKIAQILKDKQLEQQNIKIGLRIARQQNDFSYVDKIRNEIKQYTKAKRNLLRIRDQTSSKKHSKSRAIKLLTECDDMKFDFGGKVEARKIQKKIITEINEDENEEFLFEMLKKNPSQILIQRRMQNQQDSTHQWAVSLPRIKSSSRDQGVHNEINMNHN